MRYTLFVDQEAWDKFRLSKDEFDLLKEIENSKKPEIEADKSKSSPKPEDKKVEAIGFDWDGFEERKARLTIHSSIMGDAVLSKDGEKLFYLARFEK